MKSHDFSFHLVQNILLSILQKTSLTFKKAFSHVLELFQCSLFKFLDKHSTHKCVDDNNGHCSHNIFLNVILSFFIIRSNFSEDSCEAVLHKGDYTLHWIDCSKFTVASLLHVTKLIIFLISWKQFTRSRVTNIMMIMFSFWVSWKSGLGYPYSSLLKKT